MTWISVPLSPPALKLEVNQGVSMGRVFTALSTALLKSYPGRKALETVPAISVLQRRVTADPDQVARFISLCCSTEPPGLLPMVYPQVLFTPLLMTLLGARHFPLSLAGLIHTHQHIRLHRPLETGEVFNLECTLAGLAHSPEGVSVTCRLTLHDASGPVWVADSVFLARNPRYRASRKKTANKRKTVKLPHDTPIWGILEAPVDLGRRYAAVSGDYNPIHLTGISARMFGFRRPIAHGIWALARSVAVMQKQLSPARPIQLEAALKRPVWLPGRAVLAVDHAPEIVPEPGISHFRLRDDHTGVPHLEGRLFSRQAD